MISKIHPPITDLRFPIPTALMYFGTIDADSVSYRGDLKPEDTSQGLDQSNCKLFGSRTSACQIFNFDAPAFSIQGLNGLNGPSGLNS